MHKTRKPAATGRQAVQTPRTAVRSGRTQAVFFPESPPDIKVANINSRAITFPAELSIGPPIGSAITVLPVTVVRHPPSERLLMRKSEPPPTPPTEIETPPQVAKKKAAKARTATTAKPRKKAAKPAAKRATKTAPRKAPTARKPKAPANDTGAPVQPTGLIKDVAPALPPIMALPPTSPLPRNAAVTAWRKNGPIDVLAYWVRSTAKSLLNRFKTRTKAVAKPKVQMPIAQAPAAPPAPTPTPSEMDQLRAENALLRERIEQLLDSRVERRKDA